MHFIKVLLIFLTFCRGALPSPQSALGALLLGLTFAAAAVTPEDIADWEEKLSVIEARIDQGISDETVAAQTQREAADLKLTVTGCIAEGEELTSQLQADLEVIGDDVVEPVIAETAENDIGDSEIQDKVDEIHLQRLAMENQITQLRIRGQECRFLSLRADKAAKSAARLQQTLSAQRLGSQGPTLFRGIKDALRDPALPFALAVEHVVEEAERAGLGKSRFLKLFLLLIVTWLVGELAKRLLNVWSTKQRGRGGEPTISMVFARNAVSSLPIIFTAFTASAFLYVFTLPDPGDSIWYRAANAVFLFGIGRVLISWLVGPYSPGANFLDTPELPGLISRRLTTLVVALLVTYVVFGRDGLESAPPQHLWVLRAIAIFVIGSVLIWVVNSAREIPSLRGKLIPLRFVIIVAAMVSVAAEFVGFRNLTNHLMTAILTTLGGGLVLWTALWVLRSLLQGLTHGTSKVSYQVRNWLGMRPAEKRSEFGWIRLILGFALWLGFAALLISVWDPSGNVLPLLENQIKQGIPIGQDKTLVLMDILVGLSAFGLLLAITTWIKARLSTRWLRDMNMDRGSREAVVTLSGYIGFTLALLIGVVLAGVDLKGLAFIFAALSVGIGFGLQNIVANFVSGLILLFERPIKSGDYVSVGEVEGVIKQIRIRSTEIETQDRQTVIVPNSELVSAQVTNWVLHDPHGRLILNIGVAYGSDTEKVREILQATAADHPEVLTSGMTPKPRALFMGFGDSSLDFELRVWIRHIERRWGVTSDLNFAIDKAFREAEIEIPFPQRDLHVRSWSNDINFADADEYPDDADFNDSPNEPEPKPRLAQNNQIMGIGRNQAAGSRRFVPPM